MVHARGLPAVHDDDLSDVWPDDGPAAGHRTGGFRPHCLPGPGGFEHGGSAGLCGSGTRGRLWAAGQLPHPPHRAAGGEVRALFTLSVPAALGDLVFGAEPAAPLELNAAWLVAGRGGGMDSPACPLGLGAVGRNSAAGPTLADPPTCGLGRPTAHHHLLAGRRCLPCAVNARSSRMDSSPRQANGI